MRCGGGRSVGHDTSGSGCGWSGGSCYRKQRYKDKKKNLKILQWGESWTQCNRKGLEPITKGKLNINYDRKGSEHIEKKKKTCTFCNKNCL